MSKSKTKSSSTQTVDGTTNTQGGNNPWNAASVDAGLGKAGGIFEAAAGGRYPTGNLITPFTRQSNTGFDMIENAVGSANPVVQSAAAANTGLTGGQNAFMQGSKGHLGRITGNDQTYLSQIGANPNAMVHAEAVGRNPDANRFLDRIGSNEHRSRMFDMGATRLGDNLRAEFAGTGMVGGDRHQIAAGRGLGDYASRFHHDAYATDQRNALQAQSILDAGYGSDQRNLLAKQGIANQAYQSNQANQLRAHGQALQGIQTGAAGNLGIANLQNQAANAAGGVASNLFIPGQAMRGIGREIEDKNQAVIDANVRRELYNQQRPLDVLSQYMGAITPANQAFGTNWQDRQVAGTTHTTGSQKKTGFSLFGM